METQERIQAGEPETNGAFLLATRGEIILDVREQLGERPMVDRLAFMCATATPADGNLSPGLLREPGGHNGAD